MKVVTLKFNEQELSVMASALGKMPYEGVAPLIANIQTQINEQVQVDAGKENKPED